MIHVESIQRPDGIRFQSVRPMTEDHWWEWTPLYQGPNTNQRDLTLNLGPRPVVRHGSRAPRNEACQHRFVPELHLTDSREKGEFA